MAILLNILQFSENTYFQIILNTYENVIKLNEICIVFRYEYSYFAKGAEWVECQKLQSMNNIKIWLHLSNSNTI